MLYFDSNEIELKLISKNQDSMKTEIYDEKMDSLKTGYYHECLMADILKKGETP